jgi:hypothetical protein
MIAGWDSGNGPGGCAAAKTRRPCGVPRRRGRRRKRSGPPRRAASRVWRPTRPPASTGANRLSTSPSSPRAEPAGYRAAVSGSAGVLSPGSFTCVCVLGRVHHDDGTRRVMDASLTDGTEERPYKAAMPARPDDKKVVTGYVLNQDICGGSLDELAVDRDVFDLSDDGVGCLLEHGLSRASEVGDIDTERLRPVPADGARPSRHVFVAERPGVNDPKRRLAQPRLGKRPAQGFRRPDDPSTPTTTAGEPSDLIGVLTSSPFRIPRFGVPRRRDPVSFGSAGGTAVIRLQPWAARDVGHRRGRRLHCARRHGRASVSVPSRARRRSSESRGRSFPSSSR